MLLNIVRFWTIKGDFQLAVYCYEIKTGQNLMLRKISAEKESVKKP